MYVYSQIKKKNPNSILEECYTQTLSASLSFLIGFFIIIIIIIIIALGFRACYVTYLQSLLFPAVAIDALSVPSRTVTRVVNPILAPTQKQTRKKKKPRLQEVL